MKLLRILALNLVRTFRVTPGILLQQHYKKAGLFLWGIGLQIEIKQP